MLWTAEAAIVEATDDTAIRTALAGFFANNLPGVSFDAAADDQPLLSGILDSLAMVNLTMFLADEFGFELSDDDFTHENFATLGALVRLVAAKSVETS